MVRSAPGAPLTPEEKRKQVEQALEYALDAAVIEKPGDVLPYVTMKLRVHAAGRCSTALLRPLLAHRVASSASRPYPLLVGCRVALMALDGTRPRPPQPHGPSVAVSRRPVGWLGLGAPEKARSFDVSRRLLAHVAPRARRRNGRSRRSG